MDWRNVWARTGLRAEDKRKLLLMAPVFLVCGMAEALNSNGFMTLFNQRLGGSYLPYVYGAEAVILPFEAWGMSLLASKLAKPALMRLQYAALTAIVLANAAFLLVMRGIGAELPLYYAVLFLTSNFVVRQQTIMLWSLAVDVCPTQQAKRLMPFFVSGATLGGMFGGIVTQLVSPLGADIVYAIGPALLIAASFNYRKAIGRYLVPLALRGAAEAGEGSLSSLHYFRGTFRSPFLLGMLGLMTLMPALYFLIEYVFVNTAHAHYPDEADFGRAFGAVSTLLFALAFLLQFVSGKLTARLGASGMIVGISAVYAVFFALSFSLYDTPFGMAAVAASYMLMNVLVYYTAEPSYQLFYKTLPLRHRDGFRFAAQGLASFLGLAAGVGLQLLHNGLGWSFAALAAAGAGVAALMLLLSWFVRQLYIRALVASVRTTLAEEKNVTESLGELTGNARAMDAVRALLEDPRAEAREIALDILGSAGGGRYREAILEKVEDGSDRVRLAALRALNLADADLNAMIKVASALEDEEPAIRAEAVRKLAQMRHLPDKAFFFLRMKLVDPHPDVVAEAVKAMYMLQSEISYAACFEAIERLLGEGGGPAVPICRAVGELGLKRFAPEAEALLEDPNPSVRVAATACLGALRRAEALPKLLERLPLADLELRRATVRALTDMGDAAVEPLRDALAGDSPKTWRAAAEALAALLPEEEVRGFLSETAIAKLTELGGLAGFEPAFREMGRSDLAELASLYFAELRDTYLNAAWTVLERLTDEQAAHAVRKAVEDPDEETRSGGLEVLAEGFGERRLSQKMAATLQEDGAGRIGGTGEEAARARIAEASASADDWWREMAAAAEDGERSGKMTEDHRALGRLGKVVHLKRVSFFSGLSLEELGLIAGAAKEETFADGALLLQRGRTHEAMYVIVEGNVELRSVSAAGWEATLGVLGPGEVCGATSALEESPSTVTAQAFFGDVSVLTLHRQEVNRLVRLYPEIGIGLLRASLARIRILEEMMMRLDS